MELAKSLTSTRCVEESCLEASGADVVEWLFDVHLHAKACIGVDVG